MLPEYGQKAIFINLYEACFVRKEAKSRIALWDGTNIPIGEESIADEHPLPFTVQINPTQYKIVLTGSELLAVLLKHELILLEGGSGGEGLQAHHVKGGDSILRLHGFLELWSGQSRGGDRLIAPILWATPLDSSRSSPLLPSAHLHPRLNPRVAFALGSPPPSIFRCWN